MSIIKFNDFAKEYTDIKPEIDEAVSRVLNSGWLILGDEVKGFENEFSKYVGSKFGVGLNSGTDALYLSVKALGIGPGDEVITVSHTMIATVDAVTRNGAAAVMVDIDPDTYNIDAEKIRSAITEKTKAIIPVDLYGHPVRMREIREIADEFNLSIIEDASQSAGSEYYGRKTGSLADIAAFSLFPTKNLGAYGDAGIVVTNDENLAEMIGMLSNYGQKEKYDHRFQGINSRMDELQAAILRVKLKHLDDWNGRRRKIASLYNEFLEKSNLKLPVEENFAKHVYHLYVIRSKQRDRLQNILNSAGVPTLIHYPRGIHQQKSYTDMGYKFSLPTTEMVLKEIMSLPIHPYLTQDDVEFIADIILDGLNW